MNNGLEMFGNEISFIGLQRITGKDVEASPRSICHVFLNEICEELNSLLINVF